MSKLSTQQWRRTWMRALRQSVGRAGREALLRLSFLRLGPDLPKLLIFPGEGRDDGAANLRGYAVAEGLRRLGWNAFVIHKNLHLNQRLRLTRAFKPDLILMQMARHPLNRPTFYDAPVVFDIDDADYVNHDQASAIITVLKSSIAVIAGSETVARFCARYNRNVHVVWTGTPVSTDLPKPQTQRPPIVAWAALSPHRCPAEAGFVLRVLQRLRKLTDDFKFLVYCDDGCAEYREFADRFRGLDIEVITRPRINAYRDFLVSLDDVAVGLAPLVDMDGFSSGKSFGKVLAYMDRMVPVITHPVVDHPLFFENGRNGYMFEDPDDWAIQIAHLLAHPTDRQNLAQAARRDLVNRLSTAEASRRINTILRRLIPPSGSPHGTTTL